MKVQRAGVRAHLAAPHALEQGVAVQRGAAVAYQLFQQVELARGKGHGLARLCHRAGHGVQLHVPRAQHAPAAPGAPQNALYTGHQRGYFKRLYNVIVRAKAQALYPVAQAALGRDENDRRARGAQVFQQLVAVQAGQHDVQQHKVIGVLLNAVGRRKAIVHCLAGIAHALEAHGNQPRDGLFVFYNQNAVHNAPPAFLFWFSLRPPAGGRLLPV